MQLQCISQHYCCEETVKCRPWWRRPSSILLAVRPCYLKAHVSILVKTLLKDRNRKSWLPVCRLGWNWLNHLFSFSNTFFLFPPVLIRVQSLVSFGLHVGGEKWVQRWPVMRKIMKKMRKTNQFFTPWWFVLEEQIPHWGSVKDLHFTGSHD